MEKLKFKGLESMSCLLMLWEGEISQETSKKSKNWIRKPATKVKIKLGK